jgi:hypothetical protein
MLQSKAIPLNQDLPHSAFTILNEMGCKAIRRKVSTGSTALASPARRGIEALLVLLFV